ncbi:MAG: 1-deoxy-D-xylulose-5-phosphate synthase, partial [Candidatus Omnitrophica bacterium]|nr:1-deoxy-D-xylulose-5-phosphate synthase [Candidatus Omnitrophota bacterium]
PFTYSIATFATLRSYEFIRNGPILQRLPVRIVGTGGGFDYGEAGSSHHALEDVGVMRLQPGITIVIPADSNQVRAALLSTWNFPGPVYYRLGKSCQTIIPELAGRFALGRAEMIRQGKEILFISMGSVTTEVMAASKILATQGIGCAVMVVSSFNPAPVEDLSRALASYRTVVTVEAHYVSGALGSLVSELVAEQGLSCRVFRCGIRSSFSGVIGSEQYLTHAEGFSCGRLVEIIPKILKS